MKYRVMEKQYRSKKCIVCGTENPLSLNARFYQLENGELATLFRGSEMHSGYPGRLHGGVAAAVLDESIGRAALVIKPGTFSVTLELTVRYHRPVPLNTELLVLSRVRDVKSRMYEGEGRLLLPDGTLAVSAKGKYLIMPIGKITGDALTDELLYPEDPDAPLEIDTKEQKI